MTIGVALKAKDAVVLACDAQVTADTGYTTTATKLHKLSPSHALLYAGAVDVCTNTIHHLKEFLGSNNTNADTHSIANDTARLLGEVYSESGARLGQPPVTMAQNMPAAFLIGGYDRKGGPQIWKVSPFGVIAPVEDYGLIGSGTPYAGLALKERYTPNIDLKRGQFAATSAVLTAQSDAYVGIDFKLATITSKGYEARDNFLEHLFKPIDRISRKAHGDIVTILLSKSEGGLPSEDVRAAESRLKKILERDIGQIIERYA